MSLIKRIMPVLIFLLVVTIAWVGFSIYFQTVDVEVNANATNFTKPINNSFDMETLGELIERTEESFPVSPQEFLKLNKVD